MPTAAEIADSNKDVADKDAELTVRRVQMPNLPNVPDYSGTDPGGDKVNHPMHYGGADDPYEAIKVIQNWELDFELGSVLKYIARAGKKQGETALTDLNKAARYLQFEIDKRSR